MHKSTSGAHLVCAWAELDLSMSWGFSWSWTPSCNVFWALNSGSWRVSGVWLQNAAWNWRWAPVYIIKSWVKCELLYISKKLWISTFQRRWERAIWSFVAPENSFRVQGGQIPTASAVLCQPPIRVLLRSLNFSQKISEITKKHTNS